MRASIEFDDKNLLIVEEVWNDLKKEKGTVAFSSVISTVTETLKRDGAFMIYDDNNGIKRRFDRLSEFEAYISEINDQRKQEGLETVEPRRSASD